MGSARRPLLHQAQLVAVAAAVAGLLAWHLAGPGCGPGDGGRARVLRTRAARVALAAESNRSLVLPDWLLAGQSNESVLTTARDAPTVPFGEWFREDAFAAALSAHGLAVTTRPPQHVAVIPTEAFSSADGGRLVRALEAHGSQQHVRLHCPGLRVPASFMRRHAPLVLAALRGLRLAPHFEAAVRRRRSRIAELAAAGAAAANASGGAGLSAAPTDGAVPAQTARSGGGGGGSGDGAAGAAGTGVGRPSSGDGSGSGRRGPAAAEPRFNVLHLRLERDWGAHCAGWAGDNCGNDTAAVGDRLRAAGFETEVPLVVVCSFQNAVPELLAAALASLRRAGYARVVLGSALGEAEGGALGELWRGEGALVAHELGLAAARFMGNSASTLSALLILERRGARPPRPSHHYNGGSIPLADFLPFFGDDAASAQQ